MIDTSALVADLPGRRWFGGKGRAISGIEPIDSAVVRQGPPALVVSLCEVVFSDGDRHLYHLPLLVSPDATPRDAFDEPTVLGVFGELMAHAASFTSKRGSFHFGGPGLDPLAPPGRESLRTIQEEQTNSSFVMDERVIVKLFRRLERGPNPDLELTRLLTNEGFEHVPAQVGDVVYEMPNGDAIDLGLAQHYLPDAVDGWSRITEALHRFYDKAASAQTARDLDQVDEHAADSLDPLESLGDVTASLHVFLSRKELEAEFLPEPVDASDVKAWSEGARALMHALMEEKTPKITELKDDIEATIGALEQTSDVGLKTRIHGDYHLGQVLVDPRGWMIIDFEGEPARSLEERRAKHSPLKDVAGMLRSIGYAATAALFERCNLGDDEWTRLEPWARVWEDLARHRFLSAYLRTSHEGRFLPSDRDAMQSLLDFFELDKALYEVRYELHHRPEWLSIPMRGIGQLVAGGKRQ